MKASIRQSQAWSKVDLLLLGGFLALLYGLIHLSHQWKAELQPSAHISLEWTALPYYTLLSLSRGLAAYGLSLFFTFSIGYWAAYRPRAEKILIPLLDILQSIPVLGFLPGAVMALVALFPHTNTGLELACILMIFTGQVWNMTFSFYYSLKSIPRELQEASQVYHLKPWARFKYLEGPASIIGLVWNSMVSMASGWFFLTVTEAFVLGDKDFRLPGLGSYMSMAIEQQNYVAMGFGILAMILMIVAVDQILWKPLVVWSQKFKFENTASQDVGESWVLNLLRQSRFFLRQTTRIKTWLLKFSSNRTQKKKKSLRPSYLALSIQKLGLVLVLGLFFYGSLKAFQLLKPLKLSDLSQILTAAGLTFSRVLACVLLGTLWTVPLGVKIGSSPKLSRILQPIIQVLASFPAPMVYPLLLLAFSKMGVSLGIGSILLMMVGTQWYLLFNVIAGTLSIPQELKETANAYRFNFYQRWRHLILPTLFPSLVTGWITAAGGAWNASIVAEYIQLGENTFFTHGLGSLISLSTNHGQFALLTASLLVMALVVVLSSRLIWKPLSNLAQRRFAKE